MEAMPWAWPCDLVLGQDVVHAGLEAGSHGIGVPVDVALGDKLEGGVSGGCGEGVGVEGAGVVDALDAIVGGVAGEGHHVDDVGTACYCASGETSGSDFG